MKNYEELLRKYIRHVTEEEGIDFISDSRIDFSRVDFSDDEKQELRRLAYEVSHA